MTRTSGAAFLVFAALALGALASHAAFAHLEKPARVLAQPVAVVTGWGWSGAEAWSIFAAAMALAGIAYALVLRGALRAPASGVRDVTAVVAASALATAAAFGFAYMLSSDVYAYAAYGAYAATGRNPYVHRTFPPAQIVDPAWTAAIGFEWPSLPACVYGPAFVALARAVVIATRFDLAHAILGLRLVAMAAFITSVAVAALAFPRRGTLLAAAIGLNPVVVSSVADGHCDAIAFLVLGVAALAVRARLASGVLIGGLIAGASAAFKATGAAAALALGYGLASRRFVAAASLGIALAIAAQLIATRLAGGFQTVAATDFVGSGPAAIAIGLRGLLALALGARGLSYAGTGARAQALAMGALLVWTLYPQDYPWYGLWLLPLAAFTLEHREGWVLIALTFTSALRYLSDAIGYAPAAPWLEVIALAPLVALILPVRGAARPPGFAEKTLPT
jgi:alpha-1,6-mannosyltransferase